MDSMANNEYTDNIFIGIGIHVWIRFNIISAYNFLPIMFRNEMKI